jgi:hypothetical protein
MLIGCSQFLFGGIIAELLLCQLISLLSIVVEYGANEKRVVHLFDGLFRSS